MTTIKKAIATQQSGAVRQGVPPPPTLLQPSLKLAYLLKNPHSVWHDFDQGIEPDDMMLLGEIYAERRAILAAGASEARVVQWLSPINCCVRNPQPADAVRLFAGGLLLMFDDLPAAVFNTETQREAARRWNFFPSAAEVMEIVGPLRKRWLTMRVRCLDLATQLERLERDRARPRSASSEIWTA